MKLVFYMLKKFGKIFIGAVMFFVMILELVNLFTNLWNYINRGVAINQVAEIMLYYMPRCIWYSVPMAMLFATAYMLSDLYAKNELLAVFASGISLFRFTLPLLILSIAMSFGMFFFEDKVVVNTDNHFNALQRQALRREKSLNNDNVVIISNEGKVVYNANFYDNKLQRLYNVYIIIRTEDKSLDSIIYADSANWSDDHWELANARRYYKLGEEYTSTPRITSEFTNLLTEPPETFQNNTINITEVNTDVAREYIDHLEKAGLPSAEAKAEYYKKFGFPLVNFIVVFLAIGLSGKTRKNVLLISLALSVIAVVVFYVTQMVTMLMAKFGAIPPIMGEWFPIMLFTIISMLLLKYART